MTLGELRDGIHSVGAIDWDRRLFDELIPLPDGTTYNAYLVRGSEKTALIDTVDPTKEQELLDHLQQLEVDRIDYVISNHAEQDHSGAIPRVLEAYPEARVVTNAQCKEFLKALLMVPEEKFVTVAGGDTLQLGGRTLSFIMVPWVHWPETMFTYLREERLLFTCDFLGSHLATSDLYAHDEARVYEAAKRYYAEIMMPFRRIIRRHLKTLDEMEVEMVAPSHGPIYDRPQFIVDAYKDWVSDRVDNMVVLPYVSMHGSTAGMVSHLTEALMNRGVGVQPFNLTVTDLGFLAEALVDAATLVLATPTVLGGAHPQAVYAAYLANALRPKLRFATIIGSYGWGERAVKQVTSLLTNLKVDLLPPVLVNGLPREEDYKALDQLADKIAEKHKELGIL